ncbi:MAG: hypothetical protein M3P48_06085 [Actinomycetota bacterium]|nr:hypothetical protein [Actinomycetota bacterium]
MRELRDAGACLTFISDGELVRGVRQHRLTELCACSAAERDHHERR